MAMRPKLRNARVVERTKAEAAAVRREKRSVPSHAVASSTAIAASALTARPAPGPVPTAFIAAAISQ